MDVAEWGTIAASRTAWSLEGRGWVPPGKIIEFLSDRESGMYVGVYCVVV